MPQALPARSQSAPSTAEMPTTGTPLWPRKLMSFQARDQKLPMWPASRPSISGNRLCTISCSTRVRTLLRVKTRFSPVTPASVVIRTRMQPNLEIPPSALWMGAAIGSTTACVERLVIFMNAAPSADDGGSGGAIPLDDGGVGLAAEPRPLRHRDACLAGRVVAIQAGLGLHPQVLDGR